MTTTQPAIRIGRIDFTNVWPLFYHFPFQNFGSELEVVQQVPTGLNQAMAEGSIQIGPISSFAYAEHADDYMLFPDMSVSAHGAVESILLFHRKELSELHGAKVMLPTTSATSVNLLKIILKKFYNVEPQYAYAPPVLEAMMDNADAALLIGDHAINASWRDTGYQVTDLGAEWLKWTGEWMSFAVCTIRKQAIAEHPKLIERIYHAFLESKRKSLEDLDSMVRDAKALIGGQDAYWKHYFSNLCYEFGPKQWSGLQLYYKYAAELGYLAKEVPLHIWQDHSAVRVT